MGASDDCATCGPRTKWSEVLTVCMYFGIGDPYAAGCKEKVSVCTTGGDCRAGKRLAQIVHENHPRRDEHPHPWTHAVVVCKNGDVLFVKNGTHPPPEAQA